MAIEINKRTKILAGVVVLAAVAAGAWFFFLDDFLNEPPPAPKAAAVTPAKQAPAAPGADAKRAAAAPAGAPAGATVAKPADAPKAGDAPKAAAAAAPAKPIPTKPDQLIAEVIEVSGTKAMMQNFASYAGATAVGGGSPTGPGADASRAITDAMARVFEPGKMTAELAASLKSGLDAERMSRYLEILRQPVAAKVTAESSRAAQPAELREFVENARKNPLPPARLKLIQTLDDATQSSAVATEMIGAMARDMVDAMLAELKKAGRKVPKGARESVAAQLNTLRDQARGQVLAQMQFALRNISDEDLAAYVKLIDTDTGRWGSGQLTEAVRAVFASRFGAYGREIAQAALTNRMTTLAKEPQEAAAEPLPKAQPAPEEKTAAAPAAPAEPVGYRRPANIKDLYTRYNDLISATVMRDGAAVKELLDGGKFPDSRQADGMTPLMIAAANGDLEVAKLLLAKGANPNLRASGGTSALSLAKSRGAAGAPMIQLLQGSGAKE